MQISTRDAERRRRVNHHVQREMWNLFKKKKTPAEMLRCARDSDPARPVFRSSCASWHVFFRPRVRAVASPPTLTPRANTLPPHHLRALTAQGE